MTLIPFSLDNEFDLSTFAGRFQKHFGCMNPLNFYSSNH